MSHPHQKRKCICAPPYRDESGAEVFGNEDCPVHFPDSSLSSESGHEIWEATKPSIRLSRRLPSPLWSGGVSDDRAVWKYQVGEPGPTGRAWVDLPESAVVLSVGLQDDVMVLWALVDAPATGPSGPHEAQPKPDVP